MNIHEFFEGLLLGLSLWAILGIAAAFLNSFIKRVMEKTASPIVFFILFFPFIWLKTLSFPWQRFYQVFFQKEVRAVYATFLENKKRKKEEEEEINRLVEEANRDQDIEEE